MSDTLRGHKELQRRIGELKADGCICPLQFVPDQGLTGDIVPTCPVHFPSRQSAGGSDE